MKVAVFSVLALLVAVNAGVVPQKKFTVTTDEINQLMGDAVTYNINKLKALEPLRSPEFGSYAIKSGDIDLKMDLIDVETYIGDISSKSVSSSLTDNQVAGQVGFTFKGLKMTGKLTAKGTVKGKAYEQVGHVVIPWTNVGEKVSFGASYDDKSVTVEYVDLDVLFAPPTIQISGLSFEGVSQEEMTSLFSAEFAKEMQEVQQRAKDSTKGVAESLNVTYAGKNIQEIYDEYRKEIPKN